jgi:hypothetical protein
MKAPEPCQGLALLCEAEHYPGVYSSMKKAFYSFLAVALVISMSSADAYAAVAAAMLRSNGGVSVNGSPVTPVTTVFAGDRIETAPQAAASLTMNGSSLMLDPNSSLVFTGNEMNFYCGGGTVQAGQGLSARFGRVAVTPAKGTARFQVQQSGDTLKVSAIDGPLALSDGATTMNLAAGNSASLPNMGCGQLAKNIPQNTVNMNSGNMNPGVNGAPNPPPIASAQTPAPVYTRGMLVAPAAVLGVAVTGIVLIQQHPVSPSGP